MTTNDSKRAWRRWARVAIPSPNAAVNERVIDHLLGYLASSPGRVLIYRPMPGEISLEPLMTADLDRLLVTRTPPQGPLTVHRADAPTERHRFGFEQPVEGSAPEDLSTITAVMVPGVLFGDDGTRLGHGAGYYDRLLPTLPNSAHRIAVSWSAMTIGTVPVDDHDIAMTHIVDEHHLRSVT